MEHVDYVYAIGKPDEAAEDRLERADIGVLALASDGDAYAVPVAHRDDAGSLSVRLSTDGPSTTLSYLEDTDTV